MLNLDLQRAELALKAGRLEDVIRLLDNSELHRHRRGQDLVDRLVQALVSRGREHFEAEHYQAAQADAEAAAALAGRTPEATELIQAINKQLGQSDQQRQQSIIEDAEQAYRTGRLDRLLGLESELSQSSSSARSVVDLKEKLGRCRQLTSLFRASDFPEVQRHLRLLARCYQDDGWVDEATELVSQIVSPLEKLRSGPLGLTSTTSQAFRMPTSRPDRVLPPLANKTSEPIPEIQQPNSLDSFLLNVDGLGSLMLLTASKVFIGGTGKSLACDLVLQTDQIDTPLVIQRDGDDYLASCDIPFRVNDTETKRTLLDDEDLVRIGRRGRLRFRKSVAASGSAILQLTAAGTKRRDVRHVVLMSDSLLFGPAGCHFNLGGFSKGVVLSVLDGQFSIRTLGESDSRRELPLNGSVVVEGTRFGLREIA